MHRLGFRSVRENEKREVWGMIGGALLINGRNGAVEPDEEVCLMTAVARQPRSQIGSGPC